MEHGYLTNFHLCRVNPGWQTGLRFRQFLLRRLQLGFDLLDRFGPSFLRGVVRVLLSCSGICPLSIRLYIRIDLTVLGPVQVVYEFVDLGHLLLQFRRWFTSLGETGSSQQREQNEPPRPFHDSPRGGWKTTYRNVV